MCVVLLICSSILVRCSTDSVNCTIQSSLTNLFDPEGRGGQAAAGFGKNRGCSTRRRRLPAALRSTRPARGSVCTQGPRAAPAQPSEARRAPHGDQEGHQREYVVLDFV